MQWRLWLVNTQAPSARASSDDSNAAAAVFQNCTYLKNAPRTCNNKFKFIETECESVDMYLEQRNENYFFKNNCFTLL